MGEEIQYIGTSNNTIVYVGSNIPYKTFKLETQSSAITRIYISTQVPTSDLGEVGDLCIRRITGGFAPSAVELFWKGFRKDGIETVWRTLQLSKAPVKVQHPLHPEMYLHSFLLDPLRPGWCKKIPQRQTQQDFNLSAALFLRTHETGYSFDNPIDLDNSNPFNTYPGSGTFDDPMNLL